MATQRTTTIFSKLRSYGAVPIVMIRTAALEVSGQQVKRSTATLASPSAKTSAATRDRFLKMFARAYFPGRTGQLLIVSRERDFITRPDPNYAYMHGSP